VSEPAVLRLMLELSLEARPIQGWLQPEGGKRTEFVGLIDLVAALEALQIRRGATPVEGAGMDPDI
jgi:hypothetical protein